MRLQNTAIAVTASFIFMACTSAAGEKKERGIAAFKGDVRLGEKVDKICFNRSIDGFSMARKDTVVLSRGVSKDYIVEVKGVCTNLRHAQSIGIDSNLSCVSRGDYLIVSDSAFGTSTGFGPDRCYINKIHKWDKKAKKKEATPEEGS